MPKPKERQPGFEESLVVLEKIVAQLESGDLPLERALELFEEGVGLARRCQSQLEEAERKVELLLRERGEIKTVPFDMMNEIQPEDNMASKLSTAGPVAEMMGVVRENEDKEDEPDASIPF